MTATYEQTDPVGREAATYALPDPVEHQQSQFGGLKIGAAFYGWLCANAMALLLIVVPAAIGTGAGLVATVEQQASRSPETTAIIAAAVVVFLLALAYYAGGYVAGRLARFDGRRQGFVAWLLGLLVTGGLVAAAVLTGFGADQLAQVELPDIPLDEGRARLGGLVALGVAVVLTLLAALAGGKTGERYHRRVDRSVLSV